MNIYIYIFPWSCHPHALDLFLIVDISILEFIFVFVIIFFSVQPDLPETIRDEQERILEGLKEQSSEKKRIEKERHLATKYKKIKFIGSSSLLVLI